MDNKSSILIVDDSELNVVRLSDMLSREYSLMSANTGLEALAFAALHSPDLILLDVIMPDMSGFDVIVKLRQMHETKNIPVIFVTSLSTPDAEEKGLNLGAADYIAKPFNEAVVKARVRTQLKIVHAMREIERLSLYDPLTEIANRRHFDERLDVEWRRAAREGQPISFIMMDIDKFKAYNDAYGHPQGDALLKHAARIFARHAKRAADIAARMGGEEFGVLLPNTSLHASRNIAENIRSDIENMITPLPDDTVTRTTISLGVASMIPSPQTTPQDLIARADQLLYMAKKGGRNRVVSQDD